MNNLRTYMDDGACAQAQAVLAFIRDFEIECSWDDVRKHYAADIKVGRWENCREQGYVVSLKSKSHTKQLNIAFFEHRNSDQLCAVKWEQFTINSPTIRHIEKVPGVYETKWDTSFDVHYGEILKMAEWIKSELTIFYNETE